MSLGRLLYVKCDACGMIAGGNNELALTSSEAHRSARLLGFVRKNGRDLCGTYHLGCGASTWPPMPSESVEELMRLTPQQEDRALNAYRHRIQ